MNILEQKVDLNVGEEGTFISDSLQVGNDGKAMFTACPQGGNVSYDIYMQVNIASTGPDGPFEEQWAYLRSSTIFERKAGVIDNLIPGTFVRMYITNIVFYSPPGANSIHLTLRTEALSGSA